LTSPTPPASDAQRKRGARHTRDRLARAALELFIARGFHGTTTPLIAEHAGVAEGTIYRHFASKDELLSEIYRAGVRLVATPVRDADPTRPCRERLRGIAARWLEAAVREPALVRLVLSDAFGGLVDEKGRQAARDFRSELEKVVAGGKSSGEVRPGAAAVHAEVWLRLATLPLEHVAQGTWKPDDPPVHLVLDAAWDAIRGEGATGA
jgi:AcrR family transcriptional regulator